jgi:hypothetical protein
VDAADYTIWRNSLGSGDDSILNGNGDGVAGVGAGDYDVWKLHFGTNYAAGGGAFSTNVPEPAAAWLAAIGGTLLSVRVLRNRTSRKSAGAVDRSPLPVEYLRK